MRRYVGPLIFVYLCAAGCSDQQDQDATLDVTSESAAAEEVREASAPTPASVQVESVPEAAPVVESPQEQDTLELKSVRARWGDASDNKPFADPGGRYMSIKASITNSSANETIDVTSCVAQIDVLFENRRSESFTSKNFCRPDEAVQYMRDYGAPIGFRPIALKPGSSAEIDTCIGFGSAICQLNGPFIPGKYSGYGVEAVKLRLIFRGETPFGDNFKGQRGFDDVPLPVPGDYFELG